MTPPAKSTSKKKISPRASSTRKRTASKGKAASAKRTASKATATRAKRVSAATRKPAAKQQLARWTDEQVTLLLSTVKSSPTAKAAFERVAGELGKSVGTVQQKYYGLQRKAGATSHRRPGRPRGSAVRSTVTSTVHSTARAAASTTSSVKLSGMSNIELARLVRAATAELESRMSSLEKNVRRLLG